MLTHFYHQILRKYHIAFGTLFKQIVVVRDDADGNESQRIVVPIEYAARESWLTRLRKDPNMDQKTSNIRPRMAFEMTNIHYDGNRKLNNFNGRYTSLPGFSGGRKYFNGIPYILTFGLYVSTRSVEDANQILEQIVPYFTPDYTVTVNVIPSVGIIDRMRVVMDGSPGWTDSYEQDGFQRTRDILLTFTFNVAATLYGPIPETPTSIIRKVIVDLYDAPYDSSLTAPDHIITNDLQMILLDGVDGRLLDEGADTTLQDIARKARIEVVPVPPDVAPTRPVTANVTITEYADGKVANVFTGEDVVN